MSMLRDPAHETARAALKNRITAARRRLDLLPPPWHPEHEDAHARVHAEINALIDRLREMSRP